MRRRKLRRTDRQAIPKRRTMPRLVTLDRADRRSRIEMLPAADGWPLPLRASEMPDLRPMPDRIDVGDLGIMLGARI